MDNKVTHYDEMCIYILEYTMPRLHSNWRCW